MEHTENSARAAGWHIWAGMTLGGHPSSIALCPDHARGRRVPVEKPASYDEPLW